MKYLLSLAIVLLFITAASSAETNHEHQALDAKQITLFKTYPLNTCIVSDEALGGDMGDALSFVYEGQEFTICCKSCVKKFAKDPHTYVTKLAQKTKAAIKTPAAHDDHKEKADDHGKHDHGDHKH